MPKTKVQNTQTTQLLHWIYRFQKELEPKIHTQSRVERCFRLSLSERAVPDHFPFVFWKAPFLFEQRSWLLAEEIMSGLYHNAINDIGAFFNENREDILCAMINYALWKGRFSWLYSLASLYHQQASFHSELFELTTLSLAYTKKYNIAESYYNQIKNPSPYFYLCYQKLVEYPLHIEKKDIPKNVSLGHSLLKASWEENPYTKQQIIKRLCELPKEEDELLDRYAALLALGLLFRATRLILRYLRGSSIKDYLLDIVLQSYLQNQKHYAYLLCVLSSSFQLQERHWYEVEYCISCLNLEAGKAKIWKSIVKNKESTPKYPQVMEQHCFLDLMQKAKQDQALLPPNTAPIYHSIIINRYLSTVISEGNMLRRRYGLYRQLIREPLARGQEMDPSYASIYGSSLFWTLYLYLDSLEQTPFITLLESLAGQNLALRALFAIHHFKRDSRELSAKLLLSTTHNHPMLKTLQLELLMEKGQLRRAEKIANYLARTYPKDPVLQANRAFVQERRSKQKP